MLGRYSGVKDDVERITCAWGVVSGETLKDGPNGLCRPCEVGWLHMHVGVPGTAGFCSPALTPARHAPSPMGLSQAG